MKKKYLLLVNTDFKLTAEQTKVLDSIKIETSKDTIKIKKIFKKDLSTSNFRKKFETIIKKFDFIYLFDIFHITIDINYLRDLYEKDFFIIKNKSFDISEYFHSIELRDREFVYFFLMHLDHSKITNLNIFLKKSIQKIGRDNKKNEYLEKNKVWKFGRPKNKKGVSQFDRDKEIIRYRLNRGKTPIEILKDLGYGSISALKHFIKSRYKKEYI